MKNAPNQFVLQVSSSVGYSQFFSKYPFITFNSSELHLKSPYEVYGSGYRATPSDFTTNTLEIKIFLIPINSTVNVTMGNRFFNKKSGWIVSGSYHNTFLGENSLYLKMILSRDGKNLPVLTSMQERVYSGRKLNFGIHNKLDYQINQKNRLQLYIAFLNAGLTQIRESQKTDLTVSYEPEAGNINRTFSTRFRYNNQSLLNNTLQGEHKFNSILTFRWSAVYSKAKNQTPEEALIEYSNGLQNFIPVKQYVNFDGSTSIWRHNSDADLAGYIDFTYKPQIMAISPEFSIGGLYQQKKNEPVFTINIF